MNQNLILRSAVAGILALGTVTHANAAEDKAGGKEKCYGVSKAGKNSCANAVHACAGYSKADNSPDEWSYVAKGTCLKIGGKLTAGAPTPARDVKS